MIIQKWSRILINSYWKTFAPEYRGNADNTTPEGNFSMAGHGRASICQSGRFRNNQRGKLVSDLARSLSNEERLGGGVFNYKDTKPKPPIRLLFYLQPFQMDFLAHGKWFMT